MTKCLPAQRRHQVLTNVLQDPKQPAPPFCPHLPPHPCSLTAQPLDPHKNGRSMRAEMV